jgi:cell wall assembly regulator SMI1
MGVQMKNHPEYQKGQRWEFKHDIPEFEKTFVIAWVIEANPKWGSDWQETRYEVYIKYNPSCGKWIPPGMDGVVLTLTGMKLDTCVTKFLESGVELPWWWKYGRHCESETDVPKATYGGADVGDLPILLSCAKEQADKEEKRAVAIEKHLRKFQAVKKAPASRTIAESWNRIVAWLADHAPGYPFDLNPGADEKSIASFETDIGLELPGDFKESLRLHDGGACWLPPIYGDFLRIDRILEQWATYRTWQEEEGYGLGDEWIPAAIEGPIKPIWWNPRRIYITDNSGDHLTLDLDPPEDGVYGQILEHSHELGPVRVLAVSWSEFLQKTVEDLESGKYVYFENEVSLELLPALKSENRPSHLR